MAYINGNRVLQLVINNGGSASATLITTTTDATLVSGSTYELALTYLAETPKVNDFITYIDNGAITTLYKVTAVDSTNATLTKIGDIGGGGGSQLYQHNVCLNYSSSSRELKAFFTIINDSNQALTYQDVYNLLDNLNLEYNGDQFQKLFQVNGRFENSARSEYGIVFGMYINTQNEGYIRFAYMLLNGSVAYYAFNSATIYDYIKAL